MKHYIKSTLLALVVFGVILPIKVGAVPSSATTLKSSNFSSTEALTQSGGVISEIFTLKYKLSAPSGSDIYIPASCTSNTAANQTGTVYKLNSPNKSVFDSSCVLSAKNLVAQKQGSFSFYKIKKGETKEFTLEVRASNVRSSNKVNLSVTVESINWGSTLNTRTPQASTPNKHYPNKFNSESVPVQNSTKIPLSVNLQTNKIVNYREKFDFSWEVKGSSFKNCVATGDKVKAEQAPGELVLDPINSMLPVPHWTNIAIIPAAGKVRLEAWKIDKVGYESPYTLKVGLDCFNIFGEKASSSVDIVVNNNVVVPHISFVNGFEPDETYLNNKSATVSSTNNDVRLGTYSTGSVKRCSLAITNGNGEGTTVSIPNFPVTSVVQSRRVDFPTGNTSGYYKVTFSCFNEQNNQVDDIVYLRISSVPEIYGIEVAGLSKNSSSPNIWANGVNKKITWKSKNISPSEKVDIFLCNDSSLVNKCVPMAAYVAVNTPNDGNQNFSMFGTDKIRDANYYIKIRKAGNENIKAVTDFTFTAGVLSSAPNSGSIPPPSNTNTRIAPIIPDVSGVPTTWEHKEVKEIKWNKDKISSTKVDILLCNDMPTINKCWPTSIPNLNTDNDGVQNVSMWGAGKYISTEYYLKIRKAGGGTTLTSSKFTAGLLTQSAVDDRSNLASVLLGLQEMLNKLIGLVR